MPATIFGARAGSQDIALNDAMMLSYDANLGPDGIFGRDSEIFAFPDRPIAPPAANARNDSSAITGNGADRA